MTMSLLFSEPGDLPLGKEWWQEWVTSLPALALSTTIQSVHRQVSSTCDAPGTALGVGVTPEEETDKVCSLGACILDGMTVNMPIIKKVTSDGDVTVWQGYVRESKGATLEGVVRE